MLEKISPSSAEREVDCDSRKEGTPIVKRDHTADSPEESSPEANVVTGRRISLSSRKIEFRLAEKFDEEGLGNLSKLFDKSLLAEIFNTEGTWMDMLRRVVERNHRHSFELLGTYTNPLGHQMSFVDDCILVDNRLAVPGQLRPAVLKQIQRSQPGQGVRLDNPIYLWWPHMHKDKINLADECRSCTRYG